MTPVLIGRLTWNLEMMVWKKTFLFQGCILRFHKGCIRWGEKSTDPTVIYGSFIPSMAIGRSLELPAPCSGVALTWDPPRWREGTTGNHPSLKGVSWKPEIGEICETVLLKYGKFFFEHDLHIFVDVYIFVYFTRCLCDRI